jgi:hypothetical protein
MTLRHETIKIKMTRVAERPLRAVTRLPRRVSPEIECYHIRGMIDGVSRAPDAICF